MSDNNPIPGMMFPTQKGMLAGNPRDSAIQNMNNNQQNAGLASKLLSGGKLKKRFRGGNIAVPQFQMLYEPQGGRGTNPNDQIGANARTGTQMAANAAFDKGATIMGGKRSDSKRSGCKRSGGKRSGSKRRRSRKGGNPDWVWGCMSGGKSRRRTSRKRRTSRRRKSSRK